jgi:hypothetical protein
MFGRDILLALGFSGHSEPINGTYLLNQSLLSIFYHDSSPSERPQPPAKFRRLTLHTLQLNRNP